MSAPAGPPRPPGPLGPLGPLGSTEVSAVAVPGLPEVVAGDDLAALVVDALAAAGITATGADVVVVASKVVAKAEGRSVPAPDAAAREAAVAGESVRVVAERRLPDGRTTRVVQSRSGPVLAAAGVDASDVVPGTVLLLPADPDASARRLRAGLAARLGAPAPAVLVTDTGGRPWRDGVADFALGAAGLAVLDDARGRTDAFGRPLEVTVRAVADELAACADLVKGKAARTPVAVVRGLGGPGGMVTADDGPGAAGLVRVGPGDWFAHGHVEAVRAALGVAPGAVEPPPLLVPRPPGGPADRDPDGRDALLRRVERAAAVAAAGAAPAGASAVVQAGGGHEDGREGDPAGARVVVTGDPFAAGALAERVRVALWAEDLAADVARTPTGAVLSPLPRPAP